MKTFGLILALILTFTGCSKSGSKSGGNDSKDDSKEEKTSHHRSASLPFKSVKKITNINNSFKNEVAFGSVIMGDKLYFFSQNNMGAKLYSFDGTNLVQLSDTNPHGSDHPYVGGFHKIDSTLYFSAFDENARIKFYRYTAGDEKVTKPFLVINNNHEGPLSPKRKNIIYSYPVATTLDRGDDHPLPNLFQPTSFGGKIYFTAYDGEGYQIYRFTPPNAKSLEKVSAFGVSNGGGDVIPTILGEKDGKLHILMSNKLFQYASGDTLTDDSTSTELLLSDEFSAVLASGIRIDGALYFSGYNNSALYMFAAGDATPTLLSDTTSGGLYDSVSDLVQIGTDLYFSAVDPDYVRHIYKYALGSGTQVNNDITEICGAACDHSSQPLGQLGDQFYFRGGGDNEAHKFYTVTSMDDSTTVAAFAVNTAHGDDQPYNLTNVNGVLYFAALQGQVVGGFEGPYAINGKYKLYSYEPGSKGPVQVSNTSNGSDDSPQSFQVIGSTIYFTALDSNGDRKLFKHSVGGAMVTSGDALTNTSGTNADSVSAVNAYNGTLYISALNGDGDPHYYRYNGNIIDDDDIITEEEYQAPDDVEGKGYAILDGYIWFIGGYPAHYVVSANYNTKDSLWYVRTIYQNLFENIFPEAHAAPVSYMRMAQKPGEAGPVTYVKIYNGPDLNVKRFIGMAPVQYVKICQLYGMGTFAHVEDRAFFTGIYIPQTDSCGIGSIANGESYVSNPFPDFERRASMWGTHGYAKVFNDPKHKFMHLSAGLGRLGRSINHSKLYLYHKEKLLQISPHSGGHDLPTQMVKIKNEVYFTMDTCGGNMVLSSGRQTASCRHIYKYSLDDVL